MLGGKRFNSRRVFLLHGLLLASVMAATYLSVRAQYQNLVDQAIEEARIDQDLITRGAAQSLEKHFRLVVATLIDLDRSEEGSSLLPPQAIAHLAVVDRQTREIVAFRTGDESKLAAAVRDANWVSRLNYPSIIVGPSGSGSDVLVAVPMHGRNRVAVAILSPDQLTTEVAAAHGRGTAWAVSSLIREDGQIIVSTDANQNAGWLQKVVPESVTAQINRILSAGSAGSAIVETGTADGATLVAAQPIEMPTGSRWYVVTLRKQQREVVGARLSGVFWQLLLQGMLTVLALMVVVISTSISLWRGRRRIERLRMEMLNRDLQKARNIQLNWLPEPDYSTPQLNIAAMNQPASHISGDFYNWFELPANEDDRSRKTVLVIGDVSGHGLPAAFLMSTTQMIVKTTMPRVRDPGLCLGELNRQICSLVYNGQFVTMLIFVIDHDNAAIEIASAGQAPPLLKRGDEVRELEIDPQLVIGVDDSIEYVSQRMQIQEGDSLLMYTDGIVETRDASRDQFGVERLMKSLGRTHGEPREMIDAVVKALATHRGEEDFQDDLTLVAAQLVSMGSRAEDVAERSSREAIPT